MGTTDFVSTVVVTDVKCPYTGGLIAVETSWGNGGGYAYPLTTCCNASAKGSYPGVVCRKCYAPIEPEFTSGADLSDLAYEFGEEAATAVLAFLAKTKKEVTA